MNFEKAFQLSSYLLLLSGFLAIVEAGGFGYVTAISYLFALSLSWWLRPLRIANWQQAVLVSVLLLVFFCDALVFSQASTATVRLLLMLSLLKLFTRGSGKDYLQIYLIALALLLGAATYTPSFFFLVASVAFVYLSILTLILFENRRGYEENPATTFSLLVNLQATAAITVLILVLAIPIFFAIPRGSIGLLGGEGLNLTGFSDSVRLGELGSVLNNPQVVMRVKVDRAPDSLPPDLKWRGVALDRFDGQTWSHSGAASEPVSRDAEGRFLLAKNRRQNEQLLEQTFLVEPFSNVIFASPEAIQISGILDSQVKIHQDLNHALYLRPKPKKPFRYFVHSDLQSKNRSMRSRERTYFRAGQERYLQLPAVNPQIQALARRITEFDEPPIEKAVRVEKYLRENFEYTLDNPSAGSQDPLATFLFETRAGHCEYFASAQAVILRTLSIPARIVVGFRRGEYNEWGSYFIVRASDAHSWVEAYFPGIGWIELDPTPAVNRVDSYRVLRALAQVLDSVEVLWGEVVTFDRLKQAGFFQLIRTKLEKAWIQIAQGSWAILQHMQSNPGLVWKWIWSLKEELVMWFGVLLAMVALYRYRSYWNTLLRKGTNPGDETEVARDYYLEMLDLLREKGFVKSRFETPAEFGHRVSSRLKSDLPSRITDSYYQTRFGEIPLDSQQLANVYSLLAQLRRGGEIR